MEELQERLQFMNQQVSTQESMQEEMDNLSKQHTHVMEELQICKDTKESLSKQVEESKSQLESAHTQVREEQRRTASYKVQLETAEHKFNRCKAERNNYKQKSDSLAKELGRICKNGMMTVKDVCRKLEDADAVLAEATLLRGQKKRAQAEMQEYRSGYEQVLAMQSKIGNDGDTVRALSQKAELERVIADLTEYVNAKEMQLETLMQVNKTLQDELHFMAKARMDQGDI
mmetsp:Transcript_24352/g.37566  ORF Transcript_24352/g.37566 Transcript_24352/m.37566 type:complete len:230 (-) Transcript_24352:65-754(-)